MASDESRRRYERYVLNLYERLLPLMREGDLQLVFGRNGASLFWQTDGGNGMELAFPPSHNPIEETKEEDLQRIAEYLRNGDLKKPLASTGAGPVDVAGIIRSAINAISAFETPEVWYRGEPSVEMILRPRVFREEKSARAESSNFVRFLIGARSRYASCPADDDFASWLALMQHYGVPTRLLDWSESVLVATYFSVSDERFDSKDGRIWLLNPGKLNEVTLGSAKQVCYLRAPQVQPLLHAAFRQDAGPIEQVVAVSAPELDLRLLLQHGRFTLHGSDHPLDEHEKRAEFLRKITIPAIAKQSIRRQLSWIGIRGSTLFPDLGSLARDIREGR
jgi:hypothetical protein